MAGPTFPYTPTRGKFKGQTFASASEYNQAQKALTSGAAVPDSKPTSATPKGRAPAYSKKMVAALVETIHGLTQFTPWFRGDKAMSEQERGWLVDDWFDFGKSNPWFARLITQAFGIDVYGRIVASHVAIVGSRAVKSGAVPQQFAMVPMVAYITRSAFDGQVEDVQSDQEDGNASGPSVGLEPGSARRVDRENGLGQELFREAAAEFAAL
jgi:hypothetical protein